jgi:KUP system potassium uptake protein
MSVEHDHKTKMPALALAALGVVYGDIGTSPLYALRECFNGNHGVALEPVTVMGILSMLFWVLIITISIKYMLFVMNADNHGEGGILALTALVCPQSQKSSVFLLGVRGFTVRRWRDHARDLGAFSSRRTQTCDAAF